LRKDEQGTKEVIRRLKMAAPKAEKNNVILGIESYLNAAEHLEIIDAVGSKNVQCYYDFRNTTDAGYDAIKEFKQLSKQHICELHIKKMAFCWGKEHWIGQRYGMPFMKPAFMVMDGCRLKGPYQKMLLL
jgi:L-ribulose-5-phosphate 3-epimerase UlaE